MSLEDIRNERLRKLGLLRDAGIDPYPIESNLTHTLANVHADFEALSKGLLKMTLGGRVMAIRAQGALAFADFIDGTGEKLQAYMKKDDMDEAVFDLFVATVDIGDFVSFEGTLTTTKRGERSILVSGWKMLSKSLLPLPDKWHGLQDVEERFRKRYLDALMDSEVKGRFLARAKMVSFIRSFLEKDGYVEVETPVLQPLYGGATAQPFVTHHNALDTDFYLRISDELYLKRLLVAGFPKVYEIAKDFRNEGIDVTHNPEFTMLEFYEAYGTAGSQRMFVESLMKSLVKELFGGDTITYGEETIGFSETFNVVSYFDLLKRSALITNVETGTRDEMALKAEQLGVKVDPADSKEKILDNIYKKACRPKLIQPTFIIDYPADYLPLAKRTPANPAVVDAFQLVIGGLELVKAFSELNDPQDQAARMQAQEKDKAAGDTEAQSYDADFIEAMEHGMPPAGGVGIGIDRLAMLLTNTKNIREVVFFPTLKPR